MFPRTLIPSLLAAALLLPVTGGEAAASSFCEVRRTADGFVALREGPSAEARMLVRMRADDEVMLTEVRQGDWVRVLHWPGQTRLSDGGFARGRPGWVNRRLLGDCG